MLDVQEVIGSCKKMAINKDIQHIVVLIFLCKQEVRIVLKMKKQDDTLRGKLEEFYKDRENIT